MSQHDNVRKLNDDMAKRAHGKGDHANGSAWDRLRDDRDQKQAEGNAKRGRR